VPDATTDSIHNWIGTLQTMGTWGLVVVSLLAAFWRRIIRIYRGVVIAAGLYDRWGSSLAETIHEMLEVAARSRSEDAFRVGILERIVGVGIYICDSDGKCNAVNEVLCELFGRDSQDMRGKGWLGAIIEKDRDRVNQEWTNAVINGVPFSTTYIIHNDRLEQEITCYTDAYAIVSPGGAVVGFVGWVHPGAESRDPPSWFIKLKKS